MYHPIVLYIGLRYTKAKQRNNFISFISLVSMGGIALGVMVLITVLSVMNGFDYEIREKVFSVARQVTISGYDGAISDWQGLEKKLQKYDEVTASAPFITGQGMLSKDGLATGVLINGIIPEKENQVMGLNRFIVQGSGQSLVAGSFGIILGEGVASLINASLGDRVVLIVPRATITPLGMEPRFKRFTVVGIFHVGNGFANYDTTMAFVHLHDAGKLFRVQGDDATGINLKLRDLYRAPLVSRELRKQLVGQYTIVDWTNQYGSFFKAIQMEKTTMFVVLLFIIAIAAFNLVSSLVMSVTDRQSDIAILRTLGATPKMIMAIFIVQGGIVGLGGTLLGVLGGIILALNAPTLVMLLEKILHTSFISAGIYFIDYLPSKLIFYDILRVGLSSLSMSLLATIYPAWQAAIIDPALVLRHE